MRPTHGSAPVGDGVLDVPLYVPHPGIPAPVGEGLAPPEKTDDPAPLHEVAQIVRESFADTAGPPRTSAPTAGTEVSAAPLPVCATGQRAIHESPGAHGVGIRQRAVRERPLRRKFDKKGEPAGHGFAFFGIGFDNPRGRLRRGSEILVGCAGDHRSSSSPRGMSPASRSPSSSASSPRSSSSISPQAGHWMEPRASVSSPKLISSPQEGQVTS